MSLVFMAVCDFFDRSVVKANSRKSFGGLVVPRLAELLLKWLLIVGLTARQGMNQVGAQAEMHFAL